MRAICAIVASLVVVGTAFGDTINVPADYPTIQGAVDAANNGDEIIVAPGTYTSTQDGHVVDMKSKAVTLRASGTPEETIIDGENSRLGFLFASGESVGTSIDGFTILNGKGSSAGAIACLDASSPNISNMRIKNSLMANGGYSALTCFNNSNPTITNCTFEYNSAGCIECYFESNPVITNCNFVNNVKPGGGVGVYCNNQSTPVITNCLFESNSGVFGVIGCFGADANIQNSIIRNNKASGVYSLDGANPIISGTIICGNIPTQISGKWHDDGGNTVEDVCPAPTGACCTGTEIFCVPDVTEDNCLFWGGQWLGEGTSCDDCPPPVEPEVLGACCLHGGCVPSTAEGCFDGGGSYAGDGVDCVDAGCPEVCPGDLTGDNEVTIIDLLFVLDKWGVTCP